MFALFVLPRFFRQKTKCGSVLDIHLGKDRKHFGKMEKCWLPEFWFPPIIVSKAFIMRGVLGQDTSEPSLELVKPRKA